MKTVMLMGSTVYKEKMVEHAHKLREEATETINILMPTFDDVISLDAIELCEQNRDSIEKADEIHLFWDQRSIGTIFDFGMAFALRKPVKVIYLEPKTFAGVIQKYAKGGNL